MLPKSTCVIRIGVGTKTADDASAYPPYGQHWEFMP
jgi:hypothetical protein